MCEDCFKTKCDNEICKNYFGLIRISQLQFNTGLNELIIKIDGSSLKCKNLIREAKLLVKQLTLVDKKINKIHGPLISKSSKNDDLKQLNLAKQDEDKILQKANDEDTKLKMENPFVAHRKKTETLLGCEYVCNICTSDVLEKQLNLIVLAEQLEDKYTSFINKTIKLKNIIAKIMNDYQIVSLKLSEIYFLLKSDSTKNNNKSKLYKKYKLTDKERDEIKDAQRAFNKYVKYKVGKIFGQNILLYNQVRKLDHGIMGTIKEEAIEKYLPKNTTPIDAWKNAMNSLRQIRHQANKKRHCL